MGYPLKVGQLHLVLVVEHLHLHQLFGEFLDLGGVERHTLDLLLVAIQSLLRCHQPGFVLQLLRLQLLV